MIDRQAGLRALVGELGKNEIYGDTFSPGGLKWAARRMGGIANAIAERTTRTYTSGCPDVDPSLVQNHVREATLKSGMFAVALTMGEIKSREALIGFGQAVNGMYIPNDLVDSGGEVAGRAMRAIDFLLDKDEKRDKAEPRDPLVSALWRAITRTEENVRTIARPEDRPFVMDRIYRQVLGNEVQVQRFSRGYAKAEDEASKRAFLATYSKKIAWASTESAGVPSISSGLYALYRQQDPDLPPLAEVYADSHIVRFDRVLNTVARLWDDIGDRQKDARQGTFTINIFNQPEPKLIHEYLGLAHISGTRREDLYNAIAHFGESNNPDKASIINSLTEHTREYTSDLPKKTQKDFGHYLKMNKRVAEIALVNTKGDEILAKLASKAKKQ